MYKIRSNRIAQLRGAMLVIVTLAGGYAGMSRQGMDTAIGAGVDGVVSAVLTGDSAVGTAGGVVVSGIVGNQTGK